MINKDVAAYEGGDKDKENGERSLGATISEIEDS